MTTTAVRASSSSTRATDLTMLGRPGRLAFPALERPRDVFANITPNWFASVMGTGIVANAAATLPVQVSGLRTFGLAVWVLAVVLLVALTVATALHWVLHRDVAASHHNNPVMGHFYGAPAMALLTVGAGALLLGKDLIGLRAAIDLDWALWLVGTMFGLAIAVWLPYLTFTRHEVLPDSVFGGWLMPVVPPMVSAATGALLIPHAAAGQIQLTLLLACYAMFGLALLGSFVVITLLWLRLAQHKVGAAAMVPTLWIVLGPLGQSITAANLLGGAAHGVVPAPYDTGFTALGLVFGVPVWGFAVLWAALASAITVRTVRSGMPFSLTWWSFTFPVGTVVTGTSGLALHSHADLFRYAAVVFYVGLLAAWGIVFVRTARGSQRGELFARPRAVALPGAASGAPASGVRPVSPPAEPGAGRLPVGSPT